MIVVGLDVATVTGWCRLEHCRYRTGLIDCTPVSEHEPEGLRFRRLADALPEILEGADAVIFERTYSRGARVAEILNGLTAVALLVCEEYGVDYAWCDASTLKRFATGDGAASKDAMGLAAQGELGRELTHDEADAYFLVRYGLKHFGLTEAA